MRILQVTTLLLFAALAACADDEPTGVGESCGNDCRFEEEAWCWACGELTKNEDGVCRPQSCGAVPECEEAGPAQRGEFCGEQWWCERACADGLECAPDPCLEDDWRGRCWRPEDMPSASECPDASTE